MTDAVISRRTVLAGGASLLGLLLAGCTSSSRSGGIHPVGPAAVVTEQDVPADIVQMYAAITDDRFPIRASKIHLVPQRFWRQQVSDTTGEVPGTVVVDTKDRFLYHVGEDGLAMRYGVGIGAAGFEWSGRAHIAYKRDWPRWTPPSDMIKRRPELGRYRNGMEPGTDNPLGPRALYIHQGNEDTLYRIHGNPDEDTIGRAVSSGCVRLLPQDIIHLYENVRSGSPLLVV